MMNDALSQLALMLGKLPGIGPRQARRLAFWIVSQDRTWVESLSTALQFASRAVTVCPLCKRMHHSNTKKGGVCGICASGARDKEILMIVERDADLENIERTGSYRGRYFVLGGTAGPLDEHPEKRIRIRELIRRIQLSKEHVREMIYALSATTEGEDTLLYLDQELKDIIREKKITVSRLGRGLSTGTELEYVDKDTMDHALKSRSS